MTQPPSAALPMAPSLPGVDRLIIGIDQALRTLAQTHQARRAMPAPPPSPPMDPTAAERPVKPADVALSASLMRVNHVGEVCAQALYSAQALSTKDPLLRAHFDAAAQEEVDHLVWTEQRLKALGSRTSLLNPLWYAGAFGIGLLAGRLGDTASLGFVIETERQVEEHLVEHLERLPADDAASRAIVAVMRDDEARHASDAALAGGIRPPLPVQWLMCAAAKVMTVTAHHI